MADFPGAPLYGTAAWPFVTPVGAPTPTVDEPIDTIPGRPVLDIAYSPPTPGHLEVAGVAQASLRALDVGFTYEVEALDRFAPGDALNPTVYAVTSSPAGPVPSVQFIEHVGPGVVRLFFDADLPVGVRLTVTVSPSIEPETPGRAVGPILAASMLLPVYGASTALSTTAIDVPEVRRDLRNVQSASGTDPVGTLSIDSRGDYANEDGVEYFRKRILRRATTAAGGFVLLPGYGFAPEVKTLLRTSDLRPLTARIRSQVLLEPDCALCVVELDVPRPGILRIRIRATMTTGVVATASTTLGE